MAGTSRIFLEILFGLETTLKSPILDPKTDFSFFRPLENFSFPPQLPFSITIFQIPIVEKVSIDHTDHFGFPKKNRRDLVKRYQNKVFGGKVIFSFYHENEFISWR